MKEKRLEVSQDHLINALNSHLHSLALLNENEAVEFVGYDMRDRFYVIVKEITE